MPAETLGSGKYDVGQDAFTLFQQFPAPSVLTICFSRQESFTDDPLSSSMTFPPELAYEVGPVLR